MVAEGLYGQRSCSAQCSCRCFLTSLITSGIPCFWCDSWRIKAFAFLLFPYAVFSWLLYHLPLSATLYTPCIPSQFPYLLWVGGGAYRPPLGSVSGDIKYLTVDGLWNLGSNPDYSFLLVRMEGEGESCYSAFWMEEHCGVFTPYASLRVCRDISCQCHFSIFYLMKGQFTGNRFKPSPVNKNAQWRICSF